MFHLPFVVDVDINEAVEALKAAGIQVLAADATGDSLPELASDGSLNKPTAWMFGNEAWGFEPEILKLADRVVAVPIYGAAESLNLATAASVCLYSSAFQQNSAIS
jgi:TrmH family RNA methyltransferase